MRKLLFDSMKFQRDSLAWCPITGRRVDAGIPRVIENLMLAPVGEPVIYYRFPASQEFMDYEAYPGCYTRVDHTTHHFDEELDALEAAIPGIDRTVMGTSFEGRNIEKFQLGPDSGEIFAVTCAIHGNEVDGLRGSLKAFEILCTHPDFATLRSLYTLVLWPCCNPDGYYNGTRDLAALGPHPTGVDKGINLNREWPWFWTEYVPTSNESKGYAPIGSDEAQTLYAWKMTGNAGNPIKLRFLLDQHATDGDGARYQSRDRCFRDVEEGDLETIWADWNIYRLQKATQAIRVQNDGMPDLWINYFRSRFRPHWHPWISTRPKSENGGIVTVCLVDEYNKVTTQEADSDLETYESACNYTLDYLISCARIMQGTATVRKSAVLIEHETATNLAQNSQFDQWQERNDAGDPIDYRPGYWGVSRTEMAASGNSERHMQYQGRPIRLSADLSFEVPGDCTVGPEDYHDVKTFYTGSDLCLIVQSNASLEEAPVFSILSCSMPAKPSFHLSSYGNQAEFEVAAWSQARLVKCTQDEIYFVLLNEGGETLLISLIDSGTGFESAEVDSIAEPRVDAATAGGLESLYIIGGIDDEASDSPKVFEVSTSEIVELGTDLLPTADSGFSAILCEGGTLDGMIIAVGGVAAPGTPATLKVVVIDPASPSATEYLIDTSDTEMPYRIVRSGLFWDSDSDKLLVYGGHNPDDTDEIYGGAWSLTWNGSSFDVADEEIIGGFDDDGDPEDVSGQENWNGQWTNWRYWNYSDSDTGVVTPIFIGGKMYDPGTDAVDPGPYTGMYCHYRSDNVFARPQDYSFGYLRYNSSLDPDGEAYIQTSWSAKIPATNSETSAYVRINNAPGANSGAVLTTRRARTYYMHPPQWWWREHAALDLTLARPDYDEDVWRSYYRYYRHQQELYLDAPMITKGSLWPSSWSPYGMTRESEYAYWENSVDPRWVSVKFTWMPAAPYIAMTSDTCLVRIGESDDDYRLELWAIVEPITERVYVRGMTKGIAEPLLELRSYSDATTYTSCSIPCYWGGYVKDTSLSRFDSPLDVRIWQNASKGFGLAVKNGYAEGWVSNRSGIDPSNWANSASLYILAGGYWSEPELFTFDRSFSDKYIKEDNQKGALLIGDRDPTYGQVSYLGAFRYIELFDRANNTNLGNNWNVIKQSGNGWDIYDNEGRCGTIGWEMWTSYPYLRDTTLQAKFRIHAVSSSFGVFQRVQWATANLRMVYGYLGSVILDGSGDATLSIEKVENNAKTTLESKAVSYTLDGSRYLDFEVDGSTLTLTYSDAFGVVIDSITVEDTTFELPGAFGICGESPTNTDYVYCERTLASPVSSKIRIVE